MSRRIAATALAAAAVLVPTAQPANAAACGVVLDYVVSRVAPEPAWGVYNKVCGV